LGERSRITRKEFLEKSAGALLGCSMSGSLNEAPSARGEALPTAELRTLGRTGIQVSSLGFGASRTMEQALLRTALDAGVNFFDTGRSYFNGQNEVMIGELIKGIRKNTVVQTKVMISRQGGDAADVVTDTFPRLTERMNTSLSQSLKALNSDYVDILVLHGISTPAILRNEEVLAFFQAAKKSGRIRACGFSAHFGQAELLRTAVEIGSYDTAMIAYNHRGAYQHMNIARHGEWDKAAIDEELDKAKKAGLGVVAIKTCSGGPYQPPGEAKASFRAAIQWAVRRDCVQVAAVAMGNMKEVEENLQVLSK